MRSYSTVVYPSAVILTDRFAMAALGFSIGNWHQRQFHAAFRVMLYQNNCLAYNLSLILIKLTMGLFVCVVLHALSSSPISIVRDTDDYCYAVDLL